MHQRFLQISNDMLVYGGITTLSCSGALQPRCRPPANIAAHACCRRPLSLQHRNGCCPFLTRECPHIMFLNSFCCRRVVVSQRCRERPWDALPSSRCVSVSATYAAIASRRFVTQCSAASLMRACSYLAAAAKAAALQTTSSSWKRTLGPGALPSIAHSQAK